MTLGTVAVAVDGSPASATALTRAVDVAREQGKSLRGVFVLDTGWADFIGNDWQSAAGARQDFLDYVLGQLEAQAEAARRQFDDATRGMADTSFEVVPGDPLEALADLAVTGQVDLLLAGRDVFQVCGRPSLKRLARDLSRRAGERVIIV